MKFLTIFTIFIISLTSISAQTEKITLPEVRAELLQRMKKDQAARDELPNEAAKITLEQVERLRSVDEENTRWLKATVLKYGWVTKSMVCDDGVYAAWLLVQHADRDAEFQKYCLKLMKRAVSVRNFPPKYFAYLTDRTLTNRNKPQIYGTQLTVKDGKFVPLPIKDEKNVDRRRKAIGLSPLKEYLAGGEGIGEMSDCVLSGSD